MDLLGVRSLPFLSRRNYFHEFRQIVPWSLLAGVVEGAFGSVVVAKAFDGGELEVAVATATPVAAFVTSLVWGMLCVGRPKVRLLMLFSAGTALLTGLAGAIPASKYGAIWFICEMAAAQVLMSGVLTTRSAVWKSNYPKSVRGRITARLQGVRFVVGTASALTAAAVCDWNPSSYRFIYPIACVFGLVAVWMARRLHIRGERAELSRRACRPVDVEVSRELVEPFSLVALLSPGRVLGQMVEVLREDRRYMLYCTAQFFTGLANLMTMSIVAAVVTRDLDYGRTWGFWVSTTLLVAIPQLSILGGLGRWGRLFDRVGVLGFRVINVSCWVLSLVMGMVATLLADAAGGAGASLFPLAVTAFAVRSVLFGLGRGGGAVAWFIGHLHFAKTEKAEIYMGIHVALTGIRGLFAPVGGVLLWQWMGWPVWLIAIAFALISLAMFTALAKEEQREIAAEQARAADRE